MTFKPIRGMTEAQSEERRQPYPIGAAYDSAGNYCEEREQHLLMPGGVYVRLPSGDDPIRRRFVAELRDRVERCDDADRLRAFDLMVHTAPDAVRDALDETEAPS